MIDTGRTRWTALVEAKVRKSQINADQLERYLKVAKANDIDAVLTLSNQFSLAPHHHPVSVKVPKGVALYHLSWMRVLTDSFLLLNQGVDDPLQEYILNEFKRFISHESAGVESFTQMPTEWSAIVDKVQSNGNILLSEAREVVAAWHQECQDLSLIFSRQIDAGVEQLLTRSEKSDPSVRVNHDVERLRDRQLLSVELNVPDAAAPISVNADLRRRTIAISMYLSAPEDRKRNSAKTNWLLRQLPEEGMENVYLRARWPKTSPWTQLSITEARKDMEPLFRDKGDMEVIGFEICRVLDLEQRFKKPRIFIEELERSVPALYEAIGQNLRPWVKPAPKLTEGRSDPETVTPSAMSD